MSTPHHPTSWLGLSLSAAAAQWIHTVTTKISTNPSSCWVSLAAAVSDHLRHTKETTDDPSSKFPLFGSVGRSPRRVMGARSVRLGACQDDHHHTTTASLDYGCEPRPAASHHFMLADTDETDATTTHSHRPSGRLLVCLYSSQERIEPRPAASHPHCTLADRRN